MLVALAAPAPPPGAAVGGAPKNFVMSASASTAENEVAVIARVTNADAWMSLSEVRDATLIGNVDNNNSIVTGRIPVSRIERVRNQPYVESLKAAQPMKPMLAVATAETDAQPAQMRGAH